MKRGYEGQLQAWTSTERSVDLTPTPKEEQENPLKRHGREAKTEGRSPLGRNLAMGEVAIGSSTHKKRIHPVVEGG